LKEGGEKRFAEYDITSKDLEADDLKVGCGVAGVDEYDDRDLRERRRGDRHGLVDKW